MKKSKIILHCIALAVAIASFVLFRAYIRVSTDTSAPEFSVDESTLELSVSDPESALLQGITARDDRDGDVTHTILVESVTAITDDHYATVTYAAFDKAGNISKVKRRIHYTDYRSPRITLDHAACFAGESAVELMDYVGAEDVIEGDISRRVRATLVSNTGSVQNEGTHLVRLSVTNSLGDFVQLEIPLEVYANGLYNAQLELKENIIYLPKGTSFNAESYLSSFTYAGKTVSLTRTRPIGFTLKYDNTVNTNTPGVYAVNYTMTFTDHNTLFTGHSVLIVVIEE